MTDIADRRYIVSALADCGVVVYADDAETARLAGLVELLAGNGDMFSLDNNSVQVDLIEEEDDNNDLD